MNLWWFSNLIILETLLHNSWLINAENQHLQQMPEVQEMIPIITEKLFQHLPSLDKYGNYYLKLYDNFVKMRANTIIRAHFKNSSILIDINFQGNKILLTRMPISISFTETT